MTREAPKWFRQWLHRFDPKLRVRWSAEKRSWEIVRLVMEVVYGEDAAGTAATTTAGVRVICERRLMPRVELTWPHAEVTESLCERLRRGANWLYGGRSVDFWRERFAEPARAVHDARRRDYARVRKEVRLDAARTIQRDIGATVTVGAGKSGKLGN